jgi:hypothetical protein
MVYVPAVPTTPDFEPVHLIYPEGQLPLSATTAVPSQGSKGGTQTAERKAELSLKLPGQAIMQSTPQKMERLPSDRSIHAPEKPPFIIWHQQFAPPPSGLPVSRSVPLVPEHIELPFTVIVAPPLPHGPVAVHVPSYVPL